MVTDSPNLLFCIMIRGNFALSRSQEFGRDWELINVMRESSEEMEFQAEVNRMMKLIIKPLYKNKVNFSEKLNFDF